MEEKIKILMIGSDRKLFEEGSAVSERIKDYGNLVEELHIVIFAKKSLGLEKKQIAPNIWLYPTNSLSRWFYPIDATRIAKGVVSSGSFEKETTLITTQDPFECGLAGVLLKNKFDFPLEIQLHKNPFSREFGGFINEIRKVLARQVLPKADGVRVVSSAVGEAVKSITKANIKVLPIYIDKRKIMDSRAEFDLHGMYPWKFILLTVSRLSREKNIQTVIEALSIVRKNFPETGLVVVGDGPEKGNLTRLAKKLGLERAVEFVGWQNDANSYYKSADAFIQASAFEGYGLSLVEAGISGLPIVTTSVGIAQELEHNSDAFIYPKADPELFAEGIMELIQNNFKRGSMKINIVKTLEQKLLSKEDYLLEMKNSWETLVKTSK